MIRRLRKVTSDLYRGSAPNPIDVINLKNKLNINKIVSLDLKSANNIRDITKKLGIEHIIIPLDMTRSSLMNLFQHDLKELLLEGGPTYIHCLHGKDRTGLVIALLKCKYLNVDPEDAIKEAKSLGFGIGVNPKIVDLYEKLIRECKPYELKYKEDIVSNERSYIDNNRGSILDSGTQGSFAPFLDQTKQYPMSVLYNSVNEQSSTREKYKEHKRDENKKQVVPLVGLFNNDAGIRGAGPTEPVGGFIYE